MSGRKTNEKKKLQEINFPLNCFFLSQLLIISFFSPPRLTQHLLTNVREKNRWKKKEATRNKFSSQLFLPQPTIYYIIFFSSKINWTFIKLFQNLLDWASHMIPNIHWSWRHRYCGLGQEVARWFQCWKNSENCESGWICSWGKIIFRMLSLTYVLNWIGALTLSLLVKVLPRKLEPWFALWSFFLVRLLYISIKLPFGQPSMEYCCHVWASAPVYFLDLLDKLQKQVCRTVGSSHAASLWNPWLIFEM